MPLPTVTVAGTINAPDGTPFATTVWFGTTAEMVDAAGNVLYPITRVQARVVAGQLKAADGTSALTLVDSEAGLASVPYVIQESWPNGRKFTVVLTSSMVVSGHIPYSTLGPVTPAPTPTTVYASVDDLDAEITRAQTAEATKVPTSRQVAGHPLTADVTITKGDVGLGNVDNTSDANKPVSTATQTALNGKADLSGPGATVPRNQLPNISGSFWQQVANQAAMLALTAPDADTALVVFRTDTPGTVWFLNPGLNPATLGNWGSYQDDAAGAASAAQTAAIAAAATDATTKVAAEVTRATSAYLAYPQGRSDPPSRLRRPASRVEPLAKLHSQTWTGLLTGALQTRKAAYTTTIRFPGVTGATQKIPGYASLTGGTGGNSTVTTDRAFVTAVTAVYNLTTDPTRATNRFQSFFRNSQQTVMTVAPTAGDDIEVQCTVLPYQGLWSDSPPNTTTFEIVDFDGTVMVTSDGTGAGASATPSSHSPIVPKLPLPTSGAVTSDSYLGDAVQPAPNFATAGTDPRSADLRTMQERLPITVHDSSGSLVRFRRGLRFTLAGNGTRGSAQTSPQTQARTWPLGGTGGGWPSKHLTVLHALVRVADSLTADAGSYPIGRMFLFVGVCTNTSSGGVVGTVSGGTCAVDLYHLDPVTDYFDGMVTL